MKTSQDPRHKRRQHFIEELFKADFHTQKVSSEAEDILRYKDEIDVKIHKAAPDFPIDKINKIDLAILRLAVYELSFKQKEPKNVIIDEAVELAKEYANETSPSFINGVLSHISR
jgi:N utilization substance protein B